MRETPNQTPTPNQSQCPRTGTSTPPPQPCGVRRPAVDLWAAGCIFAQLWTRRPLFPGRSAAHQAELLAQFRRFLAAGRGVTGGLAPELAQASPEALELLPRPLLCSLADVTVCLPGQRTRGNPPLNGWADKGFIQRVSQLR